ncbi:MAG: type I-B CRISPR-associated protein Cas7/Cst2/DevR [Candidatus Brocadia sp.]|nr:type I-B CRISPR-associated protein Cas7/Cst2/DevR [Candidatus Brocadia sp.]
MGKVLTFTNLIEAGVVNRNDSIGNISSVKKVSTQKGVKVFFSDKAYKRAIWNRAVERGQENWRKSAVSSAGGVTQRISTIIDSEEFDFAGTMIAKPIPHNRESVLVTTYGLSINNYVSCMEFLTNMALAKELGTDKTSIYNREHFQGLYKVSGLINLDRLGEQEILIPTKISDDELELNAGMSVDEFLAAFYGALAYVDNESMPMTMSDFISSLSLLIQEGPDINLTKNQKGYEIKLAVGQTTLGEKNMVLPELKGDTATKKKTLAKFLLDFLVNDANIVDEDRNKVSDRIEKFISKVDITGNVLTLTLNKNSGKQQKEKIDEPHSNGSNEEKVKWLHKIYKNYLKFQVPEDEFVKLGNERIASISIDKEGNNYKVKISLKSEEKFRRLGILFDTICNLYRTIEGRVENLCPVFSIWSAELPNPVFHNHIDDMISSYSPLKVDKTKLSNVANGKTIFYGREASTFKEGLFASVKSYYGI